MTNRTRRDKVQDPELYLSRELDSAIQDDILRYLIKTMNDPANPTTELKVLMSRNRHGEE